jgi:hypothetical protein
MSIIFCDDRPRASRRQLLDAGLIERMERREFLISWQRMTAEWRSPIIECLTVA